MATDLELANRAIGRVGGEPIDDFNDDTPLSEFCTIEWPGLKATLLGGYRWVFASKIAKLTQLADLPDGCPLPFAFQPPADLAGAVHAARNAQDFRSAALVTLLEFQDYFCSDQPEVWIEYTFAPAADAWPPWFVDLAVTAFASRVAPQVLRRELANDLKIEAFGPPEMTGKGGLMLAAMQADSRDAPARSLTYQSGGALNEARWGIGVGAGQGMGSNGTFPTGTWPVAVG